MSASTPRIALGGIFHESNTFLKNPTPLSAFEVLQGEQILSLRNARNTVAGFLEVAEESGWEVVPTLLVRRMASGIVEDEVVDFFQDRFFRACPPDVDALFLPLHGAMTARSTPDVEGNFLRACRDHLHPTTLIFGVLDLHANYTQLMADQANALLAYRENPHTDGYETSRRSASLLRETLQHGAPPRTFWKHSRHLIPATGTGTADPPMKNLEAEARAIEDTHPDVLAVNILAGFAHADVPDAGLAYSIICRDLGPDPDPFFRRLDAVLQANLPEGSPEQPLPDLLPRLVEAAEFPTVLAEPADNIGGGASGDNTEVLQALLDYPGHPSGIILWDPDAVQALQPLPLGTSTTLPLGGKSGEIGARPLELEVELVSRSDGNYTLEDPQSHLGSSWGLYIKMGPCAVVRHRHCVILLTSIPSPPFDLAQWRSQGFDPETFHFINAKAAVAFRQAYEKIAKRIVYVDTTGPCTSNLHSLPFKNLKRPIWPFDS